jgi:chemotaxis response regulator CheB
LVGVKVLIDIAHDKEHKDQFRAAKELAAINGFTAEQRIVVEHISPDSKGMIQEIRSMAAQLGLDPKQLISAAGIIEAEFTEVPEDTEMDAVPMEDTEMDPVEDGDGE